MPPPAEPPMTLGQAGYEAYAAAPGRCGPWRTDDGAPMPTWQEMQGPDWNLTRERWEAAGRTIAAALLPSDAEKSDTP